MTRDTLQLLLWLIWMAVLFGAIAAYLIFQSAAALDLVANAPEGRIFPSSHLGTGPF
jgi:hypothetical protein